MAEVLLLDADMALLFIELAGTTRNSMLKERRLKAAAKAYCRIINFIPRVSLTGVQMAQLERRLSTLQSHLKLGIYGI